MGARLLGVALAAAVTAMPDRIERDAASLVAVAPDAPPSPPYPPPLTEAQALKAGAADNNGNISFPEGTLLPSVQCIEYMVLEHSTSLPLFKAQMQMLGMWDRVTVHIATPDPDGKAAGCFRAHVKAWNAALERGCASTLMVEEDFYFNDQSVKQSLDHADTFVAAGRSYDMLFLGYSPQQNITDGVLKSQVDPAKYMLGSVATYDDDAFQCIYRLHDWLCTQSYIISPETMERWKNLTYTPNVTPPIDLYLSSEFDNDGFFAVRPASGFQRFHPPAPGETGAEETGSANEVWKFVPGVYYSLYGAPPPCDGMSWNPGRSGSLRVRLRPSPPTRCCRDRLVAVGCFSTIVEDPH